MEFEDFLTSLQDKNLRDTLWDLFCKTETEAKQFPIDSEDWVDINLIIVSERSLWFDDGKIELDPKWDDLGQIFHETFHSAFHNSPLWNNKVNRTWGEGFCDAFRYFMEDRFLDDSKWFSNLRSYLKKNIEEILQNRRNLGWKLEYCIPATRIINKAERDYSNFRDMWKQLNQNPKNLLEDYFAYPKRELWEKFLG
jgi:hypothetical protein